MSGIEVAGVILGLYPVIITALDLYRATKGGKGALSLARNLKTEEIIFGEFVHHLVAPNVSKADLIRLKSSASPDLALWTDKTLQANMRARLGAEKADNVVGILKEMHALLKDLQRELGPIAHGVDLLRKFRAKFREVRCNLPQSSLKERLDKLTSHNIQLQRLLTDRSLPSDSTHPKQSKPSRRYLRQDLSHAVDLYNAICDGYRCECNAPHLTNFSLPKISDTSRTNSGLITGWHFELLFTIEDPAIDDTLTASSTELESLTRSWSQFTMGGGTVGGTRKVSISECETNHNSEQQRPIHDLCKFTKTIESEDQLPDPPVGVIRLKEKQYQLQIPTALQGISAQDIKCLDHLLADQHFLLSRKERIGLALSLSHAILSIYSTPWIETCWTWKDFCIDRENEGQLFATRKFYSCHRNGSTSASCASLASEFWTIHGEPILTRLGFALVELALGKRLAELRPNHQYQSLDPDTLDYLTAQNLVNSGLVMRAESRAYEDVVRACLRHQFIRSSEVIGLDSSRPNFQENAEQAIIEPLHMIVTTSWGT
ncbi:MAG: hypothetical protein LQ351_006784 [Letrouitia transgressa]|nr:MAG: hypothetical protein LQ351_006784 [Letrouitia transgressa]